MSLLAPQPRYRLYGALQNYVAVAAAVARGPSDGTDELASIEAALAAQHGVAHAVFVNQARVGLYLLARAALTPERPRVVLSPYTIHDVVNMVIAAGWEPVFCDIRLDTLNIDLDRARALIEADPRIGALLVTHLHGAAVDVAPIQDLCRARGIAILEDAAQATGARVGGRRVGTLGDAGVLSFGLMKNVNSLFGGLVLTGSDALAAAVREGQRDWPVIDRGRLARRLAQGLSLEAATAPGIFDLVTYRVFRAGFLSQVGPVNRLSQSEVAPVLRSEFPDAYARRPSLTQARLAGRQFASLDAHAQERIEKAAIYDRAFSGIPEAIAPRFSPDGSHVFMQYPVVVPDRFAFIAHLLRAGRDCAGQHLKNCAALPCFAQWAADCPNAARAENQVVLLPTYPGYRMEEVEKTAAAARAFFLGSRGATGAHATAA
ncbi:DegT/DnrJ/EryC1/StrS family aminotransferase [Salinarimonas sp. NSM]|uniref:DegT/DnrJ/EryC1/StrS family aminotransferase n=1 Tax=Salinarimonas sp. NSM TaxID=3458003 RepID=UPI0040368DBA